jgi:hypothetical protein
MVANNINNVKVEYVKESIHAPGRLNKNKK